MIKVYPAIFHVEDNSYWVEFPDLDGCFSDGESLEDAIMNAQKALGLHLCSLLDHKQTLPNASDINQITIDDGITSYVSCDPDKYRNKNKAIKKTLTIPEWLNEEAMSKNINFSQVLQNALKSELGL